MRHLAHALARSDDAMLDALAQTAKELCDASGACIGILEHCLDGAARLRWAAAVGCCAPLRDKCTTSEASSSAMAVALGGAQLFSRPDVHFPSLTSGMGDAR